MKKLDFVNIVLFAYFTVFISLFFSGFYLTAFDSSSFSSLLRVFLLVGILLLIAWKVSFKLKWNSLFITQNSSRDKVVLYLLALFFLYIILASIFHGDLAILRRTIVLLVFLAVVWSGSNYFNFNYSYLIYALGGFGFLIGSLYLYEYLRLSDFSFSGYRNNSVKSTGFSWLASYDNTITAGLHISFLCIAALWAMFNSKRKVTIIFFYLTFFILLSAVFLTFARTAWVGVLTSLLVMSIYEFKRNKTKVFAVYAVLIMLAMLYLSLFYSFDVARGLTYRDKIWVGLFENLQGVKDWVFGVGPSASVSFIKLPSGDFAVHAHNIYVETIYRNGLFGLLLFLSLLFFVVRNLIISKDNRESSFFTAIICAGAVAMFFDFSDLIYSPNLIWLWLWFPVAVSMSFRKKVT